MTDEEIKQEQDLTSEITQDALGFDDAGKSLFSQV